MNFDSNFHFDSHFSYKLSQRWDLPASWQEERTIGWDETVIPILLPLPLYTILLHLLKPTFLLMMINEQSEQEDQQTGLFPHHHGDLYSSHCSCKWRGIHSCNSEHRRRNSYIEYWNALPHNLFEVFASLSINQKYSDIHRTFKKKNLLSTHLSHCSCVVSWASTFC